MSAFDTISIQNTIDSINYKVSILHSNNYNKVFVVWLHAAYMNIKHRPIFIFSIIKGKGIRKSPFNSIQSWITLHIILKSQ